MPSFAAQRLLDRGIVMPAPETVDIGAEVNTEYVAPGVIIHAGCRLRGGKLSIGPGCVLGAEAPLTLEDSQLGHKVALKGGYVAGATLLDGADIGSCAHVRPGTLLEEEASAAHSVGLKQTLLQPYVVLGSLINFCDCLMAGGTDRRNHSEVGSSYIHFNYTPHQDKATASLFGDVPRGVMLDQRPIFLGGQGGAVGPIRVEYGITVAAGTLLRKDLPHPHRLVYGSSLTRHGEIEFTPGHYGPVARLLRANLLYIGNLIALRAWYRAVRSAFARDPYATRAHAGAIENIGVMLRERIKRLDEVARAMPAAAEAQARAGESGARVAAEQRAFAQGWPALAAVLAKRDPYPEGPDAEALMTAVALNGRETYLETIKGLPADARLAGTRWLQGIVDGVTEMVA